MTFIGDILGLLKRPTQVAPIQLRGPGRPKVQPAAAEIPVSEAEIIEALSKLLMERAEAEEVIEAAGAKRDKLLLTEGSDEALLAIGRDIDVANLTLERLDRIEQELRAKLVEVRAATARHRFNEIGEEFLDGIHAFFDALRPAILARQRLIDIRARAAESGFADRINDLELPDLRFTLTDEAVSHFLRNVDTRRMKAGEPRVTRYPVRIINGTHGAYRFGEIVGFEAAEAQRWIDAGIAEWADPLTVPPRSAKAGSVAA